MRLEGTGQGVYLLRAKTSAGWYARRAVAGFDLPGNCRIEPGMIVQIDPELALRIIRERGPHY